MSAASREYEKTLFSGCILIFALLLDCIWTIPGGTPVAAATVQRLIAPESATGGGADVNARDPTCATALHYATAFGHADVVRCLLERGAAHMCVCLIRSAHASTATVRCVCLD